MITIRGKSEVLSREDWVILNNKRETFFEEECPSYGKVDTRPKVKIRTIASHISKYSNTGNLLFIK